jgi:6-pyruvoyltetrahydropterin/6-carboxytetrahydropterin synthase
LHIHKDSDRARILRIITDFIHRSRPDGPIDCCFDLDVMTQCIINRRAEFSASHRYWLSDLSELKNFEQFGACARFPGHGHNYELYVAMVGELDRYGMVLNLSDVKHVIRKEVTEQLNFSYLNEVWPEFQETLPTTENIARAIWHRLVSHLPIVSIQLYEHPRLWAEYKGADMEASLTVGTHFSAAHRLALNELSFEENCEIYGKCARPNGHGHNYHLEVTVKGEIHPQTGMIVDLVALQKVIDEVVVEPFDHTFLNKDILYFATVVPTAENIAVRIGQLLKKPIQEIGATLQKIKLVESPNNSCEVDCTLLPDEVAESAQSEAVLSH